MTFSQTVAPGVELRLLEEADARPLYAAVDRDRERLRQWLPWVDGTHAEEAIRFFIRETREKFAAGDELHTGIWVDGAIAGAIAHHAIDAANRSASLGYWLSPGYEGRGIVTRCARAMLDYLFHERGLHRVEIRCGVGNERSCAVARRLGFVREGELRDAQWVAGRWVALAVWGMLESDWR